MNIKEILKNHALWLETKGGNGKRANLKGEVKIRCDFFADADFPSVYTFQTECRQEDIGHDEEAIFAPVWYILADDGPEIDDPIIPWAILGERLQGAILADAVSDFVEYGPNDEVEISDETTCDLSGHLLEILSGAHGESAHTESAGPDGFKINFDFKHKKMIRHGGYSYEVFFLYTVYATIFGQNIEIDEIQERLAGVWNWKTVDHSKFSPALISAIREFGLKYFFGEKSADFIEVVPVDTFKSAASNAAQNVADEMHEAYPQSAATAAQFEDTPTLSAAQ